MPGGIVLVNDAFSCGFIQSLNADSEPFAGGVEIALFDGRPHAFDGAADAAFNLTIALTAHKTLTITFQC